MVNIEMFRHPKYYKELRKAGNELAKRNAVKEDLACSGSSPARNNSDQAISDSVDPASGVDSVRPGQGPKPQASDKLVSACADQSAPSAKQQAPGTKLLEVQVIHQDLSNLKLKK